MFSQNELDIVFNVYSLVVVDLDTDEVMQLMDHHNGPFAMLIFGRVQQMKAGSLIDFIRAAGIESLSAVVQCETLVFSFDETGDTLHAWLCE